MTPHGPRCICHRCLESKKRGNPKKHYAPLKPLDLSAVKPEFRERIAKLFAREAI